MRELLSKGDADKREPGHEGAPPPLKTPFYLVMCCSCHLISQRGLSLECILGQIKGEALGGVVWEGSGNGC